MSLPEKLKVYLLVDVEASTVVFATHDAELAVRVKEAGLEHGRKADIVTVVSIRRPHATGETEHRCFGCPTPHTVSVEATTCWTSRMFETACDTAAKRAQIADGELNWRLN